MSRDELIRQLRYIHLVRTDDKLMDVLQDRGLVSDNAVHIEDVADRDLIRAYQLQTRI